MQVTHQRPCVLCLGGLDPSGGAGLQADIEAVAHCGGHALPIATCLTVQNSHKAYSVNATSKEIVQQQVEILLEDMKISACKIGVIPDQNIALVISDILEQLTGLPIVLDPVFSASHGVRFADSSTLEIIQENILPQVTIITPNHAELNQLSTAGQSIEEKAVMLCKSGPEYALVTGADTASEYVTNYFASQDKLIKSYTYPRLPHSYHGSGCTLSSTIACQLAKQVAIHDAVEQAQDYTMQTLSNADQPGNGQYIPRRLPE